MVIAVCREEREEREEVGKMDVKGPYIFAADGVDDIVGRSAEELGDDGKLVHMILAREQGLAVQHLGKDTAGTPDVDLDVILLPSKHDLRGAVVARRHVAGHLRVLNARQAEVTDLQVAVLVHENITRLQVPVDDAGRVDILEPAQDLVEEVLDELGLERA